MIYILQFLTITSNNSVEQSNVYFETYTEAFAAFMQYYDRNEYDEINIFEIDLSEPSKVAELVCSR